MRYWTPSGESRMANTRTVSVMRRIFLFILTVLTIISCTSGRRRVISYSYRSDATDYSWTAWIRPKDKVEFEIYSSNINMYRDGKSVDCVVFYGDWRDFRFDDDTTTLKMIHGSANGGKCRVVTDDISHPTQIYFLFDDVSTTWTLR